MHAAADLDTFLEQKRAQRLAVFGDAATSSLLMCGVAFLCKHFYHLLDAYCQLYVRTFLRVPDKASDDEIAARRGKVYADAIDTYHALWVVIAFLCYWLGWKHWNSESDAASDYWYWLLPLTPCVYRVFEILAALIEMYFRRADVRHHQFRILIHAFLHYLTTGFAFALFYIAADWMYASFSTPNASTGDNDSSFHGFLDPIYHSLLTVAALSPSDDPKNWLGKALILIEVFIGFVLVTFIFLNITQIWLGRGKDEGGRMKDEAAKVDS